MAIGNTKKYKEKTLKNIYNTDVFFKAVESILRGEAIYECTNGYILDMRECNEDKN